MALRCVCRSPAIISCSFQSDLRFDIWVIMHQTFAWGPTSLGAVGCRGYAERHVFRVAKCPGFHFMRSLQWRPQPVRLQAISEELEQTLAAEEFVFSGPCVDCLQSDAANPVRPRPETLSVHAGEREGRPRVADSLTTPIVQTATYTFKYETATFAVYHRTRKYWQTFLAK